jgi:Predicted transcriptional regulators
VLTARGRDFRPVLVALLAWGNRHFAPEGASVLLVDAKTGTAVEPILVDRVSGRPIKEPDYAFAPGPAATEGVRQRYASTARPPSQNGKSRPRKERAR